ncbi:MAG: SGNH/GDSL hydrolase family protein [Chitinophagales bacterium]
MKRTIMLSIFSTLFSVFAFGQSDDVSKLIPLNELGAGTYKGHTGGLYPNGSNSMPSAFYNDAVAVAESVQPLNTQGNPDASGKIVFLALGASTIAMFGNGLETNLPKTEGINKKIAYVNSGIGGQDFSDILNTSANFWKVIDGRLSSAGLSKNQVQILWIQEDDLRNHDNDLDNRGDALVDDYIQLMHICKNRYPNLKIVYMTGRHTTAFMGPDGKDQHREPKAYINGWACKWLIEKQIHGDADLRFKGAGANSALIMWGPYFWTQGDKPRSDGYTWTPSMVKPDGVHPTEAGIQKVSMDLINFWRTDPVSQLWFMAEPGTVPDVPTEEPSEPTAENDVAKVMDLMINGTVVNSIAFADITEKFKLYVTKDSVQVMKSKEKRAESVAVQIDEPGIYMYTIKDQCDREISGNFSLDDRLQVIRPKESGSSGEEDMNMPAWLLNGNNKIQKLNRLMGGEGTVKAVITDMSGKTLLELTDILNKHTDLNALLEPGDYIMHFYRANGSEITLPEGMKESFHVRY